MDLLIFNFNGFIYSSINIGLGLGTILFVVFVNLNVLLLFFLPSKFCSLIFGVSSISISKIFSKLSFKFNFFVKFFISSKLLFKEFELSISFLFLIFSNSSYPFPPSMDRSITHEFIPLSFFSSEFPLSLFSSIFWFLTQLILKITFIENRIIYLFRYIYLFVNNNYNICLFFLINNF